MSEVESYALVLVVEPDEITLSQMVRVLRRAGYQSAGASTFAYAREQILLDPPRVVLTETRLGAYSGLHLALLARHRRSDCQAVILSQNADPVLEREVVDLGAVFLVKPVPAEVVPSLVSALLGTPVSSVTSWFVVEPRVERRKGDRRRLIIPGFTPERRVAERRRPSWMTSR